MDSDPDLLAHFMRYFEIVRADTPALLEEVFRLRYQVYCVELAVPGFERDNYPDGLDRDVYDARSLHCLLRHRRTGAWAGTARLVCADPARMDAPFPAEVAGGAKMEPEYLHTASRLRRCIGENSRFILARQFRVRAGEARSADGIAEVVDSDRERNERRAPTHPMLGLLKAGMIMSWERRVCYWYAGMEPSWIGGCASSRSRSGRSAPCSIITGGAGSTGAICRTSSRTCGNGGHRYGVS